MDVLTHAIEAHVSRQANAFTTIHAEQAIRFVFAYLRRAYTCGDDMEAREMMLLASCMAGMAFNNSGLGLTRHRPRPGRAIPRSPWTGQRGHAAPRHPLQQL